MSSNVQWLPEALKYWKRGHWKAERLWAMESVTMYSVLHFTQNFHNMKYALRLSIMSSLCLYLIIWQRNQCNRFGIHWTNAWIVRTAWDTSSPHILPEHNSWTHDDNRHGKPYISFLFATINRICDWERPYCLTEFDLFNLVVDSTVWMRRINHFTKCSN